MRHGIVNGPLVSDREFKEALKQWEDTYYGMDSKDDDSNNDDDDDDDDDNDDGMLV
jgi:hypothetical protein